tara:strand:+ start:5280 stop:6230 length:951 start_codon:yes stop_codon:yes gene_type:complete
VKKIGTIITVFLLILSFTACDKFSFGSKDNGKTDKPKGPYLARVNGWSISRNEFNRQIEAIIKANEGNSAVSVSALGLLARTFVPPYIEEIDLGSLEGKQLYLNLMVNLELLAQEAETRGLHKDSDIAKDIRRSKVEILDFALLNDVLKSVTVTPLEIEEFYENEYKRTLESIDQRKVREIVVASESEATGILVELLQGSDFSRIASSRSIGESGKKGGDLGYVVYQPTRKFKRFWEAVLVLDEGQVSSIFKHPEKKEYYIVKVEDIKKGEPESLSEIYDQLDFLLKQKKSVEAIDNLIIGIKSKIEVEIKSDLLE